MRRGDNQYQFLPDGNPSENLGGLTPNDDNDNVNDNNCKYYWICMCNWYCYCDCFCYCDCNRIKRNLCCYYCCCY